MPLFQLSRRAILYDNALKFVFSTQFFHLVVDCNGHIAQGSDFFLEDFTRLHQRSKLHDIHLSGEFCQE